MDRLSIPSCCRQKRRCQVVGLLAIGLLHLFATQNVAHGADYYCDPVNGNTANYSGLYPTDQGNGTDGPWGSLESAIAAGKFAGTFSDGDTIYLLDGYHGACDTAQFHGSYRVFTDYLTIAAYPGASPKLTRVVLKGCSYWAFKGLDVSPDYAKPNSLVGTTKHSIFYGYTNDHIIIEDCNISTALDTSTWDADYWTDWSWGGIDIRANYMTVRGCTIRNVDQAVLVGNNSLMEKNLIDGFCNDALKFVGPNTTIQDNIIVNSFEDSATYHQDVIQVNGGDCSNTIIRRNYCCARTNANRDPNTVPGTQGFFIEAATFSGIIENNVILTTNGTHGITLGEGAGTSVTDTKIVNNTILHPYGIGLNGNIRFPAGTSVSNVLVRNNIASSFPTASAPANIVVDHNFDIDLHDPNTEFAGYFTGDVRLGTESKCTNAGASDGAARDDLDGRARPIGASIDIGAFEFDPEDISNHPPILLAVGSQSVVVAEQLRFSISAEDLDNDPLHYSVRGLPGEATFVTETFTWVPTPEEVGTHEVVFMVDDGKAIDSEVVTITVRTTRAENTAPVLGGIGDKSATEGVRLGFSVSGSDSDGDSLSYSANGLPTGASFSGQSFAWTPAAGQAGSYDVTFSVTDGAATDSETITIAVQAVASANAAPVLAAIGDKSVNEAAPLGFSINATDADGDSITYSANNLPDGATFSLRNFSWIPTSSQIGAHEITFVASDGQAQDSETITINVVSIGRDKVAPVVAGHSPEPDAIQVTLNHLVTLHITDAGRGVDADSVVIRVNDETVYQGDTNTYTSASGHCNRSGTRSDYRFVYQGDEMFDFDEVVTVTVDAADLEGNVMSQETYSFITEMRAFGNNWAVGGDVDAAKGKPATASNAAGDIWAAWHAGDAGSRDIYVNRLTAGAEAFGNATPLTTDLQDQCHADMAVGGDGSVYVVWQDNRRGNWDIYLSISADGTNWSRPVQVTDSDDNEINPAVIVDSQSPNRAYVAWQDDRNGHYDIYVASSVSAFVNDTASRVTTHAADQTDPDLAVDGLNNVYVVWTDTRSGQADLYGAASNNGPWTNVPLVTASGSQTDAAVAVAPGGSVLHIAWADDRPGNSDIYYARSQGLPGSPISGSTIIDDTSRARQLAPALACTGDDQAFACWQDFRHAAGGLDSDLFLAELRSGSARTNVFIGDDGTNADQGEPAIGVDGYGNPYVVWTDDRNAEDEIYYAATTIISPAPLDSKVVTAAGATVGPDPQNIDEPQDVSIIVPPGAAQSGTRITIAKILNPQALPVQSLGSYDFGPSGIEFDQPVTLTIPYRFSGGSGSAVPYWYDGLTGALSQQGITDIENIEVSDGLNALRFKTTHFTPFYLVAGDGGAGTAAGGGGGGGGGCSISATGNGAPQELVVPYAIVALVMVALRCHDRRKRRSARAA